MTLPRLSGALPRAALVAAALASVGAVVGDSYALDLLRGFCLTSVVGLGWLVFCGPTREISLGHSFLVGASAYSAALLQVRTGLAPIFALVVGIAIGAMLGAFTAILTTRHRGLPFSMLTMALQLALYRALFVYSPMFGGEEGVIGVQLLTRSRLGLYAISVAALAAAVAACEYFLRSPLGLQTWALGENETLARALGVRPGRVRLASLTMSGALAGLGGALMVLGQGQANAELAGEELSVRAVIYGLIGGLGSPLGVVGATFGLGLAQHLLSRFAIHDALLHTALLAGLVLALPRGLSRSRPRWRTTTIQNASVATEAPTRSDGGLQVEGLRVDFGGLRAVDNVTMAIRRGSSLGVIGPNGAGKTTLLAVVAGQVTPTEGLVRWGTWTAGTADVSERVRRGLRKTFQPAVFFPGLTAEEHIAVARAARTSAARDDAALDALLRRALPEGPDRPVVSLPPSAARVLDVAAAVAAVPELLLLDEPFSGLSRPECVAVAAAIQALRSRGVTLLIVEHRLDELFPLVDEVVVMHRGRVLVQGAPSTVLDHPAVREAYGVTAEAAV